jgi:L-cysteine:1D-myo-inositol 2-amino-2-deoxy-alpha-D-glucopyranoside ligase
MQSWPPTVVPSLPPSGERPVLHVHDSASGGRVAAGPTGGTARLYVCGITPYDATHLGHASTYLAFDTLVRTWLDAGIEVE